MRYWWIDTENIIALYLADKSYHDYDCDWVETPPKDKSAKDNEPLSDKQVAKILGRLYNPSTGGKIFGNKKTAEKKSETEEAELIQRGLRKELGLSNEEKQ